MSLENGISLILCIYTCLLYYAFDDADTRRKAEKRARWDDEDEL